jgi:hypothetical protein
MLRCGSVLERLPGPKYLTSLSFAELAPRAPLPRAATLRKARSALPEQLEIALRAPRGAVSGGRGTLRFDDVLEEGLQWLLRAREALDASALVIPTPADLTPSMRSRDLLRAYRDRLPPPDSGVTCVWAPRGPWEPEQAARFAESVGLVLAFDPLLDPRPPGPVVYARLTALGVRRSFSDAALDDALDVILSEPVERGYISIDSDRSFKQAQRLSHLIEGAVAQA